MAPRPGDVFDRYLVEQLLGEGGMGQVYSALDTRLHRRVALKVLRPEAASEPGSEGPARMLREARAAATLDHPNAVAIYDVGEHEGVPYIAMELVEGRPLRQFVGEASVPMSERVRWLADVARVLAEAHAHGLVHRDVKPENIMVRPDRTVKVLDFGIARRAQTAFDPTSSTAPGSIPTLTEKGAVIGTPLYMAPEQMRGEDVDGRADQFSWGVVAYELCAGTLPWTKAHQSYALVSQILSEDPPPLDTVAPEVPENVRAVIERALAKRAPDRFASMDALVAALGGAVPRGVGARRGWRAAAIIAGSVALLATGGGGLARCLTGGKTAAPPPTAAAQAPAPTAITALPPPVSTVVAALAAYSEGIQASRDGAGRLALARFRRATELDPTLAAAHLRIVLDAAADSPTSARDALQQAMLHRALLSDRDRELLDAVEPSVLPDRPDIAEWERRMEALVGRRPLDAELLFRLGGVRSYRGEFRSAADALDRALAVDPQYAWAWWSKALASAYLGDLDGAARAYDECLRISPAASTCMFGRMELAADTGDCPMVESLARRMIAAEPEDSAGRAILARSLAAEGRPRDVVLEALRQRWSRLPPAARTRVELEESMHLEMLSGDFARAEELARELEQVLATVDEEQSHADLARDLTAIADETGRVPAAGRIAQQFLAKRDAWTRSVMNEDYGIAKDVAMRMYAAERRAGMLSKGELEAKRATWLAGWEVRLEGDYRGFLWLHAWAEPASTEDEAVAALDAMPRFPGMPPFHPVTLADADLGRVLVLGGRNDDALAPLRRGAANCGAFDFPVDHVRAHQWLGRALRARGDSAGACEQYLAVLGRWGGGRPRSVTAEAARREVQALGCTARTGR